MTRLATFRRRFPLAVERLDDRIVPSLLTTRASADIDAAPVPADAINSAVSGDGRFVAFVTASRIDASGANDSNGGQDVYLKDRLTGAVTLVSQLTGSHGDADGAAWNTRPSVSDDGRFVAYEKTVVTSVFIPRLYGYYVYTYHNYVLLRDTLTNTTTNVAEGDHPHLSGDGRFLTFTSSIFNAGQPDTNGNLPDAFLYDRVAGTSTVVSTDANGNQGTFGYTTDTAVSRGGRYVAIVSSANNLVPGDTNEKTDVFLKDTVTGAITRVNVTGDGTQSTGDPVGFGRIAISDDGRFVAFQNDADDLVPGDTNHTTDVFIRDVVLGSTARLSGSAAGIEGNAGSYNPVISGDSRYVVFESDAGNLVPGDTNGSRDIFVWDRVTGSIRRASVSTAGAEGNAPSLNPAVSRDGRFVAFQSGASNLAQGDENGVADVFVRQLPRPAALAAAPDAGGPSLVKVYYPDPTRGGGYGSEAYPGFLGGTAVARGDLTDDGIDDLVTGPGADGTANVRVFDGASNALLASFLAYDAGFTGGVNVAVGDVNNDGFADVVCGPGAGGGPNVRVFSGKDRSLLVSLFAYDGAFSGGVRVAVGDANGDGYADIFCVPGAGGGPNVRVFDGRQLALGNFSSADLGHGGALVQSFYASPGTYMGGLFVTAGDVTGDGLADVVVGYERGGPNVRGYDARTSAELFSFYAFDETQTGGVRVTATDWDQDGIDDLAVGTGAGTPNMLAVISGKDRSTRLHEAFSPFLQYRYSYGSDRGVNIG